MPLLESMLELGEGIARSSRHDLLAAWAEEAIDVDAAVLVGNCVSGFEISKRSFHYF